MKGNTVKEYVKTRDLTKSLIIKCENKVLYNSKFNTFEQYMKVNERVILAEHIGKTVIGLNVKEIENDNN